MGCALQPLLRLFNQPEEVIVFQCGLHNIYLSFEVGPCQWPVVRCQLLKKMDQISTLKWGGEINKLHNALSRKAWLGTSVAKRQWTTDN
jgi:hypothetical protein